MPASVPVRILAGPLFAPALGARLKIPHAITVLGSQSDAEIGRIAAESDVVAVPQFKPSWRVAGARRPGLVHSTGAGVDAIDVASLPPGCVVCNCYGHERGVAEEAILHMLALRKGLLNLDSALRQGDWTPQKPLLPELRRCHLLILGLGHIGAEIARFGRHFDMEVTVLTRTPSPERAKGLELRALGALADLEKHLPDADFVVIAIPHNRETENLIGEKELRKMKPTAFLVNVGRALVVNEVALYQTLRDRRIAGAGLGVWYQYPQSGEKRLPSTQPFHQLDNVVMMPHKPTEETIAFRQDAIAENIRRFVAGEPLQNVVTTV